jgi:hypothetical protein
MKPSAAIAERALSERIRQTWRLRAVDDDLLAALGRHVLIAGRDLRNFGMELKHVDAGPLDLNDRQYEVLRRTRGDTPPFVFQFTAPPEHPWCFRIWALREDSLRALGRHPHVTVNESDAEAFTMALTIGRRFTTTLVSPSRYRRTRTANRRPGTCLECGAPVRSGEGYLLAPVDGSQWGVVHPTCNAALLSSVEITLDRGEPAYYLARFSDALVADDVWPAVIEPRDYSEPGLRPAHVDVAARYLKSAGVFDRAPAPVERRPELTLVRQRTSATEIAERVLEGIRRSRQSDDHREVERAVDEIEKRLTGRILRSPWVDEESLARLQRHAARLVNLAIPGPFAGSDASSTAQANFDAWPGHAIATWDWDAIRDAEAAAARKGAQMRRCEWCGNPMWLDQVERHHSCRPEESPT